MGGFFSQPPIAAATIAWAVVSTGARAQDAAASTADEEAAYTRVITERAERIVAQLGINDADKARRVRDLIAGQYRGLREIHDGRDAKLAEATRPTGDPAVAAAWTSAVGDQASLDEFALHRRFVAGLSAELTPKQLDQVKDGMTYGVVPITYSRYLELFPNLTDVEQAVIRANLLEAREFAMDAGSSEEKHGWFRKYKGRINNYLASAGYDMKQAERDWAARQRTNSGTPERSPEDL